MSLADVCQSSAEEQGDHEVPNVLSADPASDVVELGPREVTSAVASHRQLPQYTTIIDTARNSECHLTQQDDVCTCPGCRRALTLPTNIHPPPTHAPLPLETPLPSETLLPLETPLPLETRLSIDTPLLAHTPLSIHNPLSTYTPLALDTSRSVGTPLPLETPVPSESLLPLETPLSLDTKPPPYNTSSETDEFFCNAEHHISRVSHSQTSAIQALERPIQASSQRLISSPFTALVETSSQPLPVLARNFSSHLTASFSSQPLTAPPGYAFSDPLAPAELSFSYRFVSSTETSTVLDLIPAKNNQPPSRTAVDPKLGLTNLAKLQLAEPTIGDVPFACDFHKGPHPDLITEDTLYHLEKYRLWLKNAKDGLNFRIKGLRDDLTEQFKKARDDPNDDAVSDCSSEIIESLLAKYDNGEAITANLPSSELVHLPQKKKKRNKGIRKRKGANKGNQQNTAGPETSLAAAVTIESQDNGAQKEEQPHDTTTLGTQQQSQSEPDAASPRDLATEKSPDASLTAEPKEKAPKKKKKKKGGKKHQRRGQTDDLVSPGVQESPQLQPGTAAAAEAVSQEPSMQATQSMDTIETPQVLLDSDSSTETICQEPSLQDTEVDEAPAAPKRARTRKYNKRGKKGKAKPSKEQGGRRITLGSDALHSSEPETDPIAAGTEHLSKAASDAAMAEVIEEESVPSISETPISESDLEEAVAMPMPDNSQERSLVPYLFLARPASAMTNI
ncbi:hypothetical protein N7522_002495 [Penicillium canescens]|nr:hypothetical protein N7522_002495 [Penicillium canescens]